MAPLNPEVEGGVSTYFSFHINVKRVLYLFTIWHDDSNILEIVLSIILRALCIRVQVQENSEMKRS